MKIVAPYLTLPLNEVGKNAEHVREGKGREEGNEEKAGLNICNYCHRVNFNKCHNLQLGNDN